MSQVKEREHLSPTTESFLGLLEELTNSEDPEARGYASLFLERQREGGIRILETSTLFVTWGTVYEADSRDPHINFFIPKDRSIREGEVLFALREIISRAQVESLN